MVATLWRAESVDASRGRSRCVGLGRSRRRRPGCPILARMSSSRGDGSRMPARGSDPRGSAAGPCRARRPDSAGSAIRESARPSARRVHDLTQALGRFPQDGRSATLGTPTAARPSSRPSRFEPDRRGGCLPPRGGGSEGDAAQAGTPPRREARRAPDASTPATVDRPYHAWRAQVTSILKRRVSRGLVHGDTGGIHEPDTLRRLSIAVSLGLTLVGGPAASIPGVAETRSIGVRNTRLFNFVDTPAKIEDSPSCEAKVPLNADGTGISSVRRFHQVRGLP